MASEGCRDVNLERQVLRFFTDGRSQKVAQINQRPKGTLVFYSHATFTQLRAQCELRVVPDVADTWKTLEGTSLARDYMTTLAPGSILEGQDNSYTQEAHFSIIEARVLSLDWLELNPHEGHRRAIFRDGNQDAKWVVP